MKKTKPRIRARLSVKITRSSKAAAAIEKKIREIVRLNAEELSADRIPPIFR